MFLLRSYLILVPLLANVLTAAQESTIPQQPSVKAQRKQNAAQEAWFRRGRTIVNQSSAAMRLRAYQQKLLMRKQAVKTRTPTGVIPADVVSQIWQPLGPAPL